MISILGPEGTREYDAARDLRDLIIKSWPWAETNRRHDIRVIAGAKCYGQKVRDIDLVVFINADV